MPVANVRSKWSAGNLIFYESVAGNGAYVQFGEDASGMDMKFSGATSGNYMQWDESADSLLLIGENVRFRQGTFSSATVGSGVAISEAVTAAARFYADDAGAAIGTATGSVPDVKNVLVRTLITKDNSSFDMRLHSLMGQLKSVNGEWGDEQVSAVHGYLELTRTAGTITLQSYGVTAGVMATVETAGNLGVAVTHNLAGFAAISKLGYSGTFTDNTNTSGLYVGIYDSTNWSDSPTLDKWNHGVYVQAAAVDKGIQVGELSSTVSGSGVALTNIVTRVMEVHADDANTARTAGIQGRAIFGRTMIYANTTQENWGVDGLLKWSGVAHTGNVNAGVVGRFEAIGTNSTATGIGNTHVAGVMGRLGIASSAFTLGAGTFACGVLAFYNTSVANDPATGYTAAFFATASDIAGTGDWDYGFYIEDTVNGIYSTTTTQAHEFVVSTLPANARGARYAFTCAAPAMTDGYGAHEIDLTIGTATGFSIASSCWINAGDSATIKNYAWVHNDGVWMGNSATATDATIAWARVHFVFGTNTSYNNLHLFDLNLDIDQAMTSLINCNNIALAGFTAGTHASAVTGSIPFIGTGGSVKYIRVYDTAA